MTEKFVDGASTSGTKEYATASSPNTVIPSQTNLQRTSTTTRPRCRCACEKPSLSTFASITSREPERTKYARQFGLHWRQRFGGCLRTAKANRHQDSLQSC